MIDITTEKILSFPDAADQLTTKPHPNTLHRWRQKGIRGIKLESAKIGGARVTSVEALARFAARLSSEPVTTETAT